MKAAYREDIRKYAIGADQSRIVRVFDAIPVQLAKDNKKFQISKVASGARFHDYGGCIDWLRSQVYCKCRLEPVCRRSSAAWEM